MDQILIDVDELRSISTITVEVAQIMDEANSVVGAVVSEHDWKCPERVAIDEALESIKSNISDLSEIFTDFASKITDIANAYTDFINARTRLITAYEQDMVSLLSNFSSDGVISRSSHGAQMSSVVNGLESNSLDASNVASLHSSTDAISIMDCSGLTE